MSPTQTRPPSDYTPYPRMTLYNRSAIGFLFTVLRIGLTALAVSLYRSVRRSPRNEELWWQ